MYIKLIKQVFSTVVCPYVSNTRGRRIPPYASGDWESTQIQTIQ